MLLAGRVLLVVWREGLVRDGLVLAGRLLRDENEPLLATPEREKLLLDLLAPDLPPPLPLANAGPLRNSAPKKANTLNSAAIPVTAFFMDSPPYFFLVASLFWDLPSDATSVLFAGITKGIFSAPLGGLKVNMLAGTLGLSFQWLKLAQNCGCPGAFL